MTLSKQTVRHLVASLVCALSCCGAAQAQPLVGNAFRTGFEDWVDVNGANPSGHDANWGVLLTGDKPLFEQSDALLGTGATTDGIADGMYTPYMMVNNADVTPSTYTVSANMSTVDNDGFGVVFGYVDEDNYFRVGFREQGNGNLGFQQGTSIQKVVNGVTTQIFSDVIVDHFIDGTLFDVAVAVDGPNMAVTVNGFTHPMVADADLQPGKYGFHSWGQKAASSALPQYGTMIHDVSVTSATLNKSTNFDNAVVANWRTLSMLNSNGEGGQTGEDMGNFRQDFRFGTIVDDTNGFEYATTADNVDFIGPGVVIDEPGATSWDNYRMNVRMQNTDNDGIGLLFRVADDNNFYRMNFTNQGLGGNTANFRAPRGMSIQKYEQGVWSEVFRDDQANPNFVYSVGVPFDVSLTVVDDTIKVDIINDPDGTPSIISYDPIVDSGTTLLAGSVGLTNWGSGDGDLNIEYSAFQGDPDATFLSAVDELPDVSITIDRDSGNITLTNDGASDLGISGYLIGTPSGALDPAGWTSISGNYDQAANGGDGSVDSNDSWTILTSTDFELREAELSGDGGVLSGGQDVDLGDAWVKSSIEDLGAILQLSDGAIVVASIEYINGPLGASYHRSDLNADGVLSIDDFKLLYPNVLADIGALTQVQQALAGDLDRDGDVDVDDFTLFKLDINSALGPGAFESMIASAPEPSTALLALLGVAGFAASRGRVRRARSLSTAALLAVGFSSIAFLGARPAAAQPLDLSTFVQEAYPLTATFVDPEWVATPIEATFATNASASPSVLYAPGSAYNKRFIGRVTPRTDDDVIGFVLGFEPGDATRGSADVANADYLLIDWKGATQTIDFDDTDEFEDFAEFSPGGEMPVGLALSRVTQGVPTADEMWQHAELDSSFEGQVAQITRATTLGDAAYPRDNTSVLVDIRFTSTNVTVLVDGVEQFNENGSFADGSFGFYSGWQGPAPSFTNWEVVPNDFTGLSATVNRVTGEVIIANAAGTPVDLDYYSFSSDAGSLNATIGVGQWESLDLGEGDNAGEGWEEAGGSNANAIAELNYQDSSTVNGGGDLSIGNAYNTAVDSEDLVFEYRLPGSGLLLEGAVNYVSAPPLGLPGDFNDDGIVDSVDYAVWRENLGAPDETSLNGNGDMLNGVDNGDFQLWINNYGNTNLAPASPVTTPEPGAFLLALFGLCSGLGLARRC